MATIAELLPEGHPLKTQFQAEPYIPSPDIEIAQILKSGLDNHLGLVRSGRFDSFKGKSGLGFLDAFKKDPIFDSVVSLATTSVNNSDFSRQLSGALFEAMAYLYLGSIQENEAEGIIMGDEVVHIISLLHPDRFVIDNGFGQIGVDGLYVPDGFVVKEIEGQPRVIGVIEATVSPQERLRKEENIGYKFQKRVEDLGVLANKPQLIMVTPKFRDAISNGDEIVPVLNKTITNELVPEIMLLCKMNFILKTDEVRERFLGIGIVV